MEFNDVIKQFSERILSLKDTITTEETPGKIPSNIYGEGFALQFTEVIAILPTWAKSYNHQKNKKRPCW